jgi:hypothetical protein
MKNKYFAYFSTFLFAFVMGCSLFQSEETEAEVVKRDDKIFIKDRTDKLWDITHAVNNYGFRADQFQFGLGPFAITPINDPKMLNPGDPDYPENQSSFIVIGTNLHQDTRAYPLDVLSRHEIVNERFDTTYVAVGY